MVRDKALVTTYRQAKVIIQVVARLTSGANGGQSHAHAYYVESEKENTPLTARLQRIIFTLVHS